MLMWRSSIFITLMSGLFMIYILDTVSFLVSVAVWAIIMKGKVIQGATGTFPSIGMSLTGRHVGCYVDEELLSCGVWAEEGVKAGLPTTHSTL